MLRGVSQGNETALMIDNEQRQAMLLRGLFDGYYHAIHPSRGRCSTPTAKLDCPAPSAHGTVPGRQGDLRCVRHIPWVLDSIERLLRRNRWELSKVFDFDPGGTVYSRAEGLASRSGMVGYALNALKQAMHSAEVKSAAAVAV